MATPPYPEYTSGLLGAYGPVLAVLINELGDVAVTDNIYANRTGYGTRQFAHLSDLLQEASDSRIYGGLHYRFTQVVSIQVQKELADKIDQVSIVGPEYQ